MYQVETSTRLSINIRYKFPKGQTVTTQALARKWRPKNFETVVGQEHVVQGLQHALTHNRLHHAYLFTGTRGVGKTTLARIFAKCLNCEEGIKGEPCGKCSTCVSIDQGNYLDLIEIDAASRTKVEDTRDLLDNVQYAPTSGRFKIYLIDEVHMLSTHSFNALLKTLEEPPEHVKFLLATTDPQKLPATVLSRCLQYHLRHLTIVQIQAHLADILKQESIPFEEEALRVIAGAADGSIRDGMSLLDQAIAYTEGDIKADKVRTMLGCVDEVLLYGLVDAVVKADAPAGLKLAESLFGQSIDFELLLDRLARFWQQCAVMQVVPLEHSEFGLDKLEEYAKKLSPAEIQVHYQICIKAKADLKLAPDPFCGFEMTVLRMLALKDVSTIRVAEVAPAVVNEVSVSAAFAARVQTARVTPGSPARTVNTPARTASAPIKTASAPMAAVTTPAKALDDWAQTIKNLKIVGLTRQLANHTNFEKAVENKWYLQVEKAFESLLSEQIIRKLESAISEYVGNPISLEVSAEQQTAQKSPAKKAEEKREVQVKAAHDAIHDDDHVQAIKEAFNAEIDNRTIKPTATKKE